MFWENDLGKQVNKEFGKILKFLDAVEESKTKTDKIKLDAEDRIKELQTVKKNCDRVSNFFHAVTREQP